MRILLMAPRSSILQHSSPWLRIPQLSLSVLAGLTPPGHEVSIVEEEYEPTPEMSNWDLVGMTTMTANSPRAYKLAQQFREHGAKVVLGGVHPSVLPDEAGEHADSVVIGEAEGIWEKVVEDAQHDRLEKFYRNERPELGTAPFPIRKTPKHFLGLPPYVMPVMSTRGCVYDCEFCCVHRVYGHKPRHAPVEYIIADIARSNAKYLMFLDDNIGTDRQYSMALFKALVPLKKQWCGQATLRFILDDELFYEAVKSKLRGVFVGLETIEPQARKQLRKSLQSTRDYDKAIRRCQKAGVLFHASLIFGLDEQTPQVFEHTLEFLWRNSVHSISPNILTPYPGTRLFDNLMRDDRILHTNWTHYDHMSVCFKPKNMTVAELSERHLEFCRKFSSWSSIARRFLAQWRCMPLVYMGFALAKRRSNNFLEGRMRNYLAWLKEDADARYSAHELRMAPMQEAQAI